MAEQPHRRLSGRPEGAHQGRPGPRPLPSAIPPREGLASRRAGRPGGARVLQGWWLPGAAALVVIVALVLVAQKGSTPVAILGANAAPAGVVDPPPPQQLPDTGNPVLNNIYYGSVPPGAQARPVLLFVHGLGGVARDWWEALAQFGINDMYVTAYHRGYRTAFVTLNVSGERGPGQDMYVHGQTLSQQIAAVTQHYGVQQVDIVAHSKGGVDAQAAIVHFGAAPRVRNVFTLSTPHQGAELADLVFGLENSNLADVLQQLELPFDFDDGLRSMTTESMKAFREKTDTLAQQQPVRYFTAGGMDWGARSSWLRISGKALTSKGPNDGLVTVASSKLPYGTVLFAQPYHHFNIHHGTESFRWIHATLQRGGASGSQVGRAALPLTTP